MDLQKKRVQLFLLVAGIVALSFTAEKCRLLVGEASSSQSGKFTIFDCFDMSTGTLACTVKEGVKLYVYNMRSTHVEKARNLAIERAIIDALAQGIPGKDAAKLAQKEGVKAAKLATRQAKRIIGPIISSGWDFFEAIYYGGTMTEGFLRGSGTLAGAYAGGFYGEQSLGRLGYLAGSQLGSWIGGRIGLMVYDIVNGVDYLLKFVGVEHEANETPSFEDSQIYKDSEEYKTQKTLEYTNSDVSEEPEYVNSEAVSSMDESVPYENFESYENFEFS